MNCNKGLPQGQRMDGFNIVFGIIDDINRCFFPHRDITANIHYNLSYMEISFKLYKCDHFTAK